MLRPVKRGHHVWVGIVIAFVAGLAVVGVLGSGDEWVFRPEHFDAKQVTVWPVGENGVRIREVVDIDFGLSQRRGYQRIIPNDFGEPHNVVARSPDANDELDIVPGTFTTRIRVGNPWVTFTGRHRYILEYTLPDAQLSSGVLWLDVIGTDETFETERFEVVLTGFDFDGVQCDTGRRGAVGGCDFRRDEHGNQVAVIAPLPPRHGITVGGPLAGTLTPNLPEAPPRPDPVRWFQPRGFALIPLGIAAAAAVYLVGRRVGANTVVAGGAAEAAFGDLPVPTVGAIAHDVATARVPDSRLADLATIEFSPPRGLEPWQAQVLLREELSTDTVTAWFSEMIAQEALVIDGQGRDWTLHWGHNAAQLSHVDLAHLRKLFAGRDEVQLGTYDPVFGAVWADVQREQQQFIDSSGWWSRGTPSTGNAVAAVMMAILLIIVGIVGLVAVIVFVAATGRWRWVASPWLAVALAVLAPLFVALIAYRGMFASRTATGSALTLRAESFRRFLAASEGKHVEWAWSQGLLREYSAWAVALGEAKAWSAAIRAANIPAPDQALALDGPLVPFSNASMFTSTYSAPVSSDSSGSSFSSSDFGGSVGGGGGGGSSGSW